MVSVQPDTLRPGGPERFRQSETNRYILTRIPMSDLDTENLQPEENRPLLRSIARGGPVPSSTSPRATLSRR